MDYSILTDTEFFRLVTDKKDSNRLTIAYSDFVKTIFNLCTGSVNRCEILFAMTYAGTELQSLYELFRQNPKRNKESDPCYLYTRKALSFIHRTLAHIQTHVSPPSSFGANQTITPTPFQWTGSTVELVELIYGLIEMRSINNGESTITELACFIGSQFNVEIKDCYSAYVDMKRRKNNSRTYYLDKMQERLNRRMELDDEKENLRK